MGWIFVFGCLLNLVIIVSFGSKMSKRKQLSSGKALQGVALGEGVHHRPLCLLFPS